MPHKIRNSSTDNTCGTPPSYPSTATRANHAANTASSYYGTAHHNQHASGGDHCGASGDHHACDATGQYPKRLLHHHQCYGDR